MVERRETDTGKGTGMVHGVARPISHAALAETAAAAARWADTPIIDVFQAPFPREAIPALEGFRAHVRGMDRSQWDEDNLVRLANGERHAGLFGDGGGVVAIEQRARFIESLDMMATRYRFELNGRMNYSVAASRDARTGVAIMRINEATPGIDRDIEFGMLLGYDPRDIAFFANRDGGYEGVLHLLSP